MRLDQQDHRIDQQGAMSAAMLNMAINAADIRTQNRVGVGAGFQNGATRAVDRLPAQICERATFTHRRRLQQRRHLRRCRLRHRL